MDLCSDQDMGNNQPQDTAYNARREQTFSGD